MKEAKRVLLVDDDPVVSFTTERLLKRLGVEVELLKARNGLEALEIVQEACQRERCPEMILLDINMPVMDGFEFLEKLQKASDLSISVLNIVLLSSSSHHLDLAMAKQFPIIGFLQKPLTAEVLSKYL